MSDCFCKVNGRPISAFEYQNAIQGYAMDRYRKTMDQLSADELHAMEELAEEKLLARELIFQEALSQGTVADEKAVSEEMAKVVRNFPTEDEFYGTLQKAGIEPAVYRRMIQQDLTVNRLIAAKLAKLPEPGAEKVEEIYHRYPEKMQSPEKVRASHILIKVKGDDREGALAQARDLLDQATEEDFAALAQKHSACPSAGRGGDLGYFSRGDMVKPFEEAAFSLENGIVQDVVETQFGFHLIQVLSRQQAQTLTLQEATPKIRQFLQEEAGADALQEWVGELKARATIEFSPR